jgi:hypothetical protein
MEDCFTLGSLWEVLARKAPASGGIRLRQGFHLRGYGYGGRDGGQAAGAYLVQAPEYYCVLDAR